MKIEEHSTLEIFVENSKRSEVCSVCGVSGYALTKETHKNHISICYTDQSNKGKIDSKTFAYMCKECQKKMHQQWRIESEEKRIKFRSDEIKKIKKPNCDKCQINAMHNPTHSACGDCGAKAYDDCVCSLYFIEAAKISLDDLLSGLTGPMGYQRTGGIICISYSYETIFTCPIHGKQEDILGHNSRNKFYKK